MKEYLIDICLVGLLVFFINGLFNDNNIQEELFNQEIISFEEKVTKQEPVSSNEGVSTDNSDNNVSLFFKTVSDMCIEIIKTIVLIISNIISTLLMRM